MQKKAFIAAMFVASLLAFALGVIDLLNMLEYEEHATTTTASLANPGSEPESQIAGATGTLFKYDIVFTTTSGEEVRLSPYFTQSQSDELMQTNQTQITYLANRPTRIIRSGEEFSWGALNFVIGVIFSFAGLFALKKYKSESRRH